MNDILLTIAIPTYNRSNALNDCLTALAQEFGDSAEIEFLVSNNASTDETASVVAQHQAISFPKLRYFENSTNVGMDGNFAQCFREASGKYFWLFSDDDLLLPGYGTELLNLLRARDLGMVYLNGLWADDVKALRPAIVAFQYQVYPHALEFVRKVHYWLTFITGGIINKSALVNQGPSYDFDGTLLTQLGWVLPVIFTGLPNVIVTPPVIACRANNSGGYRVFQTFATNFNAILMKLVALRIIPIEARHIINNNLITGFFPHLLTANWRTFNKERALPALYFAFHAYSSFWKILLPLYYKASARALLEKLKAPFKKRAIELIYRIINSKDYQQIGFGDKSHKVVRFAHFGVNSELPTQRIIKNPEYISIGKNFTALHNLRIEAWDEYAGQIFTPKVVIGNNVNMNSDCHIGCINSIIIGDNVLMASRIYISDHSHGNVSAEELDLAPVQRRLFSKGPVIIEDNVWIGEGVCIMPNVRIGRNAIIGANSVVTKDVPSNTVVGGIPAVILRQFSIE